MPPVPRKGALTMFPPVFPIHVEALLQLYPYAPFVWLGGLVCLWLMRYTHQLGKRWGRGDYALSALVRPLGVVLIALLALAPAGPALADAAPPLRPPGSNLAPGGETQVQMVAEMVLLEIVPPNGVRIRADFTLRNQGAAEERLAVRFPLEDPSGRGDGYDKSPQVQNTAVQVDGRSVPWRTIEEPFRQGDPSIHWAAFDVAFPPAQDVRLVVSYDTALTGWGPGHGWASVSYVLETGAGWHGPIGQADIILRLPYPAGPENVHPALATAPGVRFEAGEARWHWENLEPSHADNFRETLVWPEDWQRVLAARTALAARPADAQAAVELAEAYRRAGSDSKGFVASTVLADLAQSTAEQALAQSPASADLHAELASILMWRLPYSATLDEPSLPRIRAELAAALALEPQHARALQVQQLLVGLEHAATARAATPTPSSTPMAPTPDARATQAQPTAYREPSATPSPPPTPTPPAPAAAGGPGTTSGWVILVPIAAVVLGVVAFIGLRRRG